MQSFMKDFLRDDYTLTRDEYQSMPVNDRINLKAGARMAHDAVCLEDFFEDDQTVWLYYGNPVFYMGLYTDGQSFDKYAQDEYEVMYS